MITKAITVLLLIAPVITKAILQPLGGFLSVFGPNKREKKWKNSRPWPCFGRRKMKKTKKKGSAIFSSEKAKRKNNFLSRIQFDYLILS
jgi:hypothetical protein